MPIRRTRRALAAAAVVLCGLLTTSLFIAPAARSVTPPAALAGVLSSPGEPVGPVDIPADLAASATDGPVDVLVGVHAPAATAAIAAAGVPGADPTRRAAGLDRAAGDLAAQKAAVVTAAGADAQTIQEFDHLPAELVRVQTPEALRALASAPGVASVALPHRYRTVADPDLTVIRQAEAVSAGYTGAGVTVAVIDSGLDYQRPGVGAAFGDCAAGPGTGTCRIDRLVDVAGSGLRDADAAGHGTNVAGVVAKTAPDAHLDVYGVFTADGFASDTDILTALNTITREGPGRNVRAVNLSLGDAAQHDTECSGSVYSSVFLNLRSLGILPIVAAGNSAHDAAGQYRSGVAEPACAAGAVRVGAAYAQNYSGSIDWGPGQCTDVNPVVDQVACFSQGGAMVSLLAPGIDILAAGITESGTSQAAPHVAGAVADLVSASPQATSDQIAGFLTGTGPAIIDQRDGTAIRRLDIAAAATAAAAAAKIQTPGGYVPVAPLRLLDTRYGIGARPGTVPGNGMVTLAVQGQGGLPVSGVSAVVLNVTVTEPTTAGFITAYASGGVRPLASNLNFVVGQTVPNVVVAPVGADGRVAFFNGSAGSVHLVADVSGYFRSGAVTAPGGFVPVPPVRLLDTRNGTGASPGPLAGESSVAFAVSGVSGVPVSGVSAVVLNVTVTQPAGSGFITAYASGGARPLASNLNFLAGQTVPNLVVAPVGVDGRVALFNGSAASVHLVADVSGYFLSGAVTAPGGFVPVTPDRLLDTRYGVGAPAGAVTGGDAVTVAVDGRAGLPASGVSAVVLNLTVTQPATGGFVTAFASGGARPLASNVNFLAGQTVPNMALAPVGADGRVALFNGSSGTVQLVADVSGYFLAGPG